MGALGGIHSALVNSAHGAIFVVGCDMPYLNLELVRHLLSLREQGDVIIPQTPAGMEPLHALYKKTCIPPMEAAFAAGDIKIISFFDRVRVATVSQEQVACFDPTFACFCNINTPEDYYRLRGDEMEERLASPRLVVKEV
jgi:FdhD protein